MAEPHSPIPPVDRPDMSHEMMVASKKGDAQAIVRLVAGGEDVNCVDDRLLTPVVRVLACGYGLDVVKALIDIGADLSIVNNEDYNVIHCAASGGNIECIDYMLANTTFDIDSSHNNGPTPLTLSLMKGHYEASKFLVEKGANLFAKMDDGQTRHYIEIPVRNKPVSFGTRVLNYFKHDSNLINLGPQVLSHFKEIKWQSVKPLFLLSASYSELNSSIANAYLREVACIVQDDRHYIASKVFHIPELLRVIASYFIPSKIITRDKAIEVRDAVRERVEAQLAG
jgi:hypothetical protein